MVFARENTEEIISDAVESFLEDTAAENIDEIEFDGEINPYTASDDCIASAVAASPLTPMTLPPLHLVDELKLSVLRDPGLLATNYSGGSIGWKNPLRAACEHSSVRLVEEILSLNAELAKMKNGAMHIASEKGDVWMVELLAKVPSEACLVEGFMLMTPLHLSGFRALIKTIILTSLQSVFLKTLKQETVLPLALIKNQLCTFDLLLSEIKKLDHLHELLNARDGDGNTISHTATSKNSLEIMKLLLEEGMEVCTPNYKEIRVIAEAVESFPEDDQKSNLEKAVNGDTINMFVKENSVDSQKLSNILEKNYTHERKQPPHKPGSRNSSVLTMNSRLRALMVIIATTIAAQSFTLPSKLGNDFFRDVNLTGENLRVQDLFYGRLPSYFYLMIFNTAAFINTMFLIALLVWQHYLGIVLVFLVICMCIVYVLLLKTVIPSFSVGIGTCNISSIILIWLLVIALTFSGIAIPTYCLPRVLQLFNRLRMKISKFLKTHMDELVKTL